MVLQSIQTNQSNTSRLQMRVKKIYRMSQGVNRVCRQIRKEHTLLIQDIHDMHKEAVQKFIQNSKKGDNDSKVVSVDSADVE
jgi:ribonuclease HII